MWQVMKCKSREEDLVWRPEVFPAGFSKPWKEVWTISDFLQDAWTTALRSTSVQKIRIPNAGLEDCFWSSVVILEGFRGFFHQKWFDLRCGENKTLWHLNSAVLHVFLSHIQKISIRWVKFLQNYNLVFINSYLI